MKTNNKRKRCLKTQHLNTLGQSSSIGLSASNKNMMNMILILLFLRKYVKDWGQVQQSRYKVPWLQQGASQLFSKPGAVKTGVNRWHSQSLLVSKGRSFESNPPRRPQASLSYPSSTGLQYRPTAAHPCQDISASDCGSQSLVRSSCRESMLHWNSGSRHTRHVYI